MKKQLQFFEKVGKNRYAIIAQPVKGKPLYVWDEEKKRIVPAHPSIRTSEHALRSKI